MRKFTSLVLLALSLSVPLVARGETGPTIGYDKYRLPNGLEVILSRDPSLPLVAVDIWYHVGAANEECMHRVDDFERRGLMESHVIELPRR